MEAGLIRELYRDVRRQDQPGNYKGNHDHKTEYSEKDREYADQNDYDAGHNQPSGIGRKILNHRLDRIRHVWQGLEQIPK